jgi:hypothetical protein
MCWLSWFSSFSCDCVNLMLHWTIRSVQVANEWSPISLTVPLLYLVCSNWYLPNIQHRQYEYIVYREKDEILQPQFQELVDIYIEILTIVSACGGVSVILFNLNSFQQYYRTTCMMHHLHDAYIFHSPCLTSIFQFFIVPVPNSIIKLP